MTTEVAVGPNGVFVAGRRRDVRIELHRVRERLDAAGLRAMPARAAPAEVLATWANADRRFGPATVHRARLALGLSAPFPFVATVSESASASAAAAPARTSRAGSSTVA
jgi:hypothetical protein